MAWSWSHTGRAIQAARRAFEAMDRETRETIAAEWIAFDSDPDEEHNFLDLYEPALRRVKAWDDRAVNAYVWERAEAQQTCENGGFEAWTCPYGCHLHLASFDGLEGYDPENDEGSDD